MAERASAMTNPTAQNARLGPNAAQAMVGAGVSPDAALRSAMSINNRGIPAMDRIATTAPTIDATRAVLDYSQKSNVPAQMSRFLDPTLGSRLASIKAGENIPSPVSPAMTGEGWVDIEKGTNVNSPDVQNLINMAKAASAQTGQRLTITDAIAHRDTSLQHPAGLAIDLKAYSPVTGKALPNYQTPETFSDYEKIANAMRSAQQGSFPQYNDTFRWGGYFGDKNALDLMHFDVNNPKGYGMSGGSWDAGLSPDIAKQYGVSIDPNKAPVKLDANNGTSPSGFQHMIAGAGADSFRGTPVQIAASRTGTPSVYEAAANPIANEYAKQAQADAIAAAKAAGIKSYGYNLPGYENQATVTTASTQPNVLGQQISGIQKTLEAYNKLTPAEQTAWRNANPGVIDKLAADLSVLKEKYKGTVSINEPLPEGYKVVGSGAYNVPAPGMISGYTNYKNVTFGIPKDVKTTETINATTPMARAIAPGYGADVAPTQMAAMPDDFRDTMAKLASAAPTQGPQNITPPGLNVPQNAIPSPSYFAQGNFAPEYYSSPTALQQTSPSPSYVAQGNFAPEYYSAPIAPTQVAEAPITGDVPLPRPRPVAPSPVDQALKIASASTAVRSDMIGGRQNDDARDRKRPVPVAEADMKALLAKGYTEKQIKKMTPEEINAILRPENVAGVVPPVTPTGTATAARGGRMGYAGGGRNQESEEVDSKASSNKKSTATATQPLEARYLNLLPSLPAYQPINYMTGTGTSATAPSPAIASFNNFATQQVPQMMPPSYSAPSGNTDYVGNNAVANAMRMLRMRQLLGQ